MELLSSRSGVIALAIVGGLLSLVAMAVRRRGAEQWAKRLDWASYAFMGVSMFFFIAAGLRGGAA